MIYIMLYFNKRGCYNGDVAAVRKTAFDNHTHAVYPKRGPPRGRFLRTAQVARHFHSARVCCDEDDNKRLRAFYGVPSSSAR